MVLSIKSCWLKNTPLEHHSKQLKQLQRLRLHCLQISVQILSKDFLHFYNICLGLALVCCTSLLLCRTWWYHFLYSNRLHSNIDRANWMLSEMKQSYPHRIFYMDLFYRSSVEEKKMLDPILFVYQSWICISKYHEQVLHQNTGCSNKHEYD